MDRHECISKVVDSLKAQGSFDQFRRECLSDVDTKPSYRNVIQRVEGYVNRFLSKQIWSTALNKAQLRNRLRKEIQDSDMVKNGIQHLIDQVVNQNVRDAFKDKVEDSLKDYLGIKDEGQEEGNKLDISNEDEKPNFNTDDSTKSENSNLLDISVNEKTEQISDEENFDNVSISPERPKMEMATPEHENDDFKAENTSSLGSEKMDIDDDELIYDTFEHASNFYAKVLTNSEIKLECSPDNVEETELSSNQLPDEACDELNDMTNICSYATEDAIKQEDEREKDISDVSSVHTSDLSDFDDEISIESSDEEEDKAKKKISIKHIKELAASISEEKFVPSKVEQICDSEEEKEMKDQIESDEEVIEEREEKNDTKPDTRRKRKLNSKSNNLEFSSQSNLKLSPNNKGSKVSSSFSDNVNKKEKKIPANLQEGPSTRRGSSRKRTLDEEERIETTKVAKLSVKECSQKNVANTMPVAEKPRRGRPPKNRGVGEQLQASSNKQAATSQNKRYESSDLYKPRHSLSSSRRSRPSNMIDPQTPDSNSNSTIDDQ